MIVQCIVGVIEHISENLTREMVKIAYPQKLKPSKIFLYTVFKMDKHT